MNSCCFFPTVAIPMNVVRHFAERHVACNTLFRTDQWLVCETNTIRLWCVRVCVTHSELHLVCYFFASQYIAIKQNVHVAFWIVFLTKEHLMNVSKKFTHIFFQKTLIFIGLQLFYANFCAVYTFLRIHHTWKVNFVHKNTKKANFNIDCGNVADCLSCDSHSHTFRVFSYHQMTHFCGSSDSVVDLA